MIKTALNTLTPAWAKSVLETRNPRNRLISQATVASYAADMQAGHWLISHQGIAFAENGDLLDGQHRLAAIIMAGVPVKMMVTTGLPAAFKNGLSLATMDVIDRHRIRGVGQQLALSHGWGNGNRVAAVVRAIALFFRPEGENQLKVTTPMTLAILDACALSIRSVMKSSMLATDRSNSKILAACAIYHTAFPRKASDFLETYLTGIGWTSGCPHKALEQWAKNNRITMSASRSTAVQAAAVALYYFDKGERLSLLRIHAKATDWLTNVNPSLREKVLSVTDSK